MQTSRLPWEYHADLTEDRLRHIAVLLAGTRHAALALYDPKNGDGEWSLGCRIYQRSCNQIIKAADRLPWLSIVDVSLQFIFAIGVVPIRFYHGPWDNPPSRNLACSFNELRQMTLSLRHDSPTLVWRFAVETDAVGQVTEVIFFGSASDSDIVCYYPVAFADSKVSYSLSTRRRGRGVDIPPPPVDDIPNEDQSQGDRDGKDSE